MIFIEHRKNKISELAGVQLGNGVEIDLRSEVGLPGMIHLSHDAWVRGDSFADWLDEYLRLGHTGLIILNTKEDGLEQRAREILESRAFANFLFLDTAFPTLVKNVQTGKGKQFFLRLSQYEDLENVLKFAGQVDWLWVDCFNAKPLDLEIIKLASAKFKLCMVSPELQGGDASQLSVFATTTRQFSMICTKVSHAWKAVAIED